MLNEGSGLPGNIWGPWYCDECGAGFAGVADPDGTVRAAVTGGRKVETRCLVRLRDDVEDLYFEVKHFAIDHDVDDQDASGQRYWFEVHTCVV